MNRWPHINERYLTKSKEEVDAELKEEEEALKSFCDEFLNRSDD